MNVIFNMPERKILNTSKDMRRMTFLIEGLSEGKAETIAFTLRRNLIGFIPGQAPAAMKILGANQMYAPIKGLVHDTGSLSMLIKDLKVLAVEKQTGSPAQQFAVEIDKTYSNEVIRFGDFKLSSEYVGSMDFKVLNPDKVLTYVGQEDVPVNIKVLFQCGIGYSAYNVINKKEAIPSEFKDAIMIDSLFSPIVDVSYEIKKKTPSQQTDSILLTVETDGSISPIEAVYQAAEIIKADGQMISDLFNLSVNTYDAMLNAKYAYSENSKPNEISADSGIEFANFPTNIYDLVKDQSINSIGALMEALKDAEIQEMSDMKANKELLAHKDEIISLLEKAGFKLEGF